MEDLRSKFERIWHEHYPLVSRAVYRRVGNAQDVEDIMQNAAERLHKALQKDVFILNEQAYFHRIAMNAANDHLRKRILEEEKLAAVQRMGREGYSIMEETSMELDNLWTRALYLNVVDGYPMREVAKMIGQPYEAARKNVQRLKNKLRKEHSDAKELEGYTAK